MDFFKKMWNKLKEPKIIWLVLFYVFFAILVAGTIILVVMQDKQTIFHYVLYCFAAICLTYFVYTIVHFSPRMKQFIIKTLKRFKITNTLLENYGYRTLMFSIFSFILNISYVIFLGILGVLSKSVWYISITVYYLILSMMKGNIFYSKRKHNTERKQAMAYRYCGIMFIFLTFALSGIVVLIYTSNMYFEYAGLLIYAAAAFVFYKLILSIYNIFKARKQDDLYIQSIRNVNLVSATVSVLVLQVAMFQAFSPEYNTSVANGLTGGFVSAIILSLGIFMIVKANKKLNNNLIRREKIDEEQK